jgi:hypothetical protein
MQNILLQALGPILILSVESSQKCTAQNRCQPIHLSSGMKSGLARCLPFWGQIDVLAETQVYCLDVSIMLAGCRIKTWMVGINQPKSISNIGYLVLCGPPDTDRIFTCVGMPWSARY